MIWQTNTLRLAFYNTDDESCLLFRCFNLRFSLACLYFNEFCLMPCVFVPNKRIASSAVNYFFNTVYVELSSAYATWSGPAWDRTKDIYLIRIALYR